MYRAHHIISLLNFQLGVGHTSTNHVLRHTSNNHVLRHTSTNPCLIPVYYVIVDQVSKLSDHGAAPQHLSHYICKKLAKQVIDRMQKLFQLWCFFVTYFNR